MKAPLHKLPWALLTCLVFVLGVAGHAHADDKPALLLQASKAWEEAELNKAAELYDKALKEGNLFPADVLVAYARIGTVRAAMGEKNAALSAFRVAAALDPTFELPSEAGPKAKKIYQQARKDAESQGGKLDITAEVPTQSTAGSEFVVVAHMAEAFVPLIVDVGITVQDPSVASSTVRPWSTKKPADTSVTFEVPGRVVMAGANLLVRVDAMDGNGNRWASTQARVKVEGRNAGYATFGGADDPFRDEGEKKDKKKSGGFWGSPWPWVIGGAVVAGGVAAYFVTRPGDEVTVSAPTWR